MRKLFINLFEKIRRYYWVVLLVSAIFTIPILIQLIMIIPSPFRGFGFEITRNDWIGFWGSFVGAIVGAFVTIYAIRLTITHEKDENIKPIIVINAERCETAGNSAFGGGFILSSDGIARDISDEVVLIHIRNVGLGCALNICVKAVGEKATLDCLFDVIRKDASESLRYIFSGEPENLKADVRKFSVFKEYYITKVLEVEYENINGKKYEKHFELQIVYKNELEEKDKKEYKYRIKTLI